MDSVSKAAVYLSVCLSVWTAVSQAQKLSSSPPEDSYPLDSVPRSLVEALESLLETPDNSISLSVEKKASVIPRCDVGERCAMKHGPRIGRLCDCLRGTACNTFFLRCY